MNSAMKKIVLSVFLLAAAGAALSAQTSSLASLFGTYAVAANFAQPKDAPEWGASTSWIAADGKGSVIVLVRAAPYFRMFTTDGKPVRSWGDAGLFKEAHSVHFAPDGSVWASDPNAHVIYKFSPEGQIVMTLGTKDTPGDNTSKTSFNRPNAVAIAPNGDIYVSDGYENQRVVHFTPDGKFVRIIGGTKGKAANGEMDVVHGVAIDPQGRIIVNDSANQRLTIFDKDGKFVKTLAAPSRGGIVVSADGTIYASDVNAGVVTVFKNDQMVDVIKVDGRPHGLTVDPTTGDVYTSSTLAPRFGVTKATLRRRAGAGTQ